MKNILLLLLFISTSYVKAQIISTVAGNGVNNYNGDSIQAINASLNSPRGLAIDNLGNVYIADAQNNRVRKVNKSGIITTIVGNGIAGYTGDSGLAINAQISWPASLTLDHSGNLFISDGRNHVIRKVNTNGIITTIAGNGLGGYSGDSGLATNATIGNPEGLAIDSLGNLYIADEGNNVIRMVNTSGIITTIAGNGTRGYSGDGIIATLAQLNQPSDIALNALGGIYIADQANNRIRFVDNCGIIKTIAGNGVIGFSGDSGLATAASLSSPIGIALDDQGNVYFTDYHNDRIRKVALNGIITTTAGGVKCGSQIRNYCGDGDFSTKAGLCRPTALKFDSIGNYYIADFSNDRVRKVDIHSSVGIEHLTFETNKFSIHPNPFSSQTTLNISKNSENSSISIYNSLGQLSKNINNIQGSLVTLSRELLPSGIYFLYLSRDNIIVHIEKLMIIDN